MKSYCDFHNIVLISAATVLLTTSTTSNNNFNSNLPTASAYMSSTQILHHNNNRNNGIHKPSIMRLDRLKLYSSRRNANNPNKNQESWSNRATVSDTNASTGSSSKAESRFGVRRRVRKVLEKAKRRTGIRNNSEDDDGDFYTLSGTRSSSSSFSSSARSESASSSSLFTPSTPSAPVSTSPSIVSATSAAPPRPLKTTSTVPNVVADAASIGGLGAVVVDDKSGEIDVAFDYVAPPQSELKNESKMAKQEGREEVEVSKMKELNINGSKKSSNNNGEQLKNENEELKPNGVNTSKTTQAVKKSSPASTYSPSLIQTKPQAEDILVPAKPKSYTTSTDDSTKNIESGSKTTAPTTSTQPIPEVDALRGDVSAAFSMPPPPLPFTLPNLTPEQNRLLMDGERVQFQSDMGREGSGFIAVDVKAPASVIWECLLDFYSYPETIPTVRDIQMFTNTHLAEDYYAETAVDKQKYEDGTLATLKHGIPSVTRAAFTLSKKFRLKIAAIHKYRTHPQGDYMIFTLDPACTNVVLQSAKGVWHTQSNPDGRGEVRFDFSLVPTGKARNCI